MSYSFNGIRFKSLTAYVQALKDSENRYNSYEAWSSQEDKELLELSKSLTVAELADHFKRRKGGIESRLRKHDDSDDKKYYNSLNAPIYKKNIFEQIIKDLKFAFNINNDTESDNDIITILVNQNDRSLHIKIFCFKFCIITNLFGIGLYFLIINYQ